MSSFKILKTSETQTAEISLCDDHIIRVMLKKGSEIDLLKTRENIQAYINLIDGKKYAYVFYGEDDSVVYTEDARKEAREHEKMFPKTCVAVIVKTLAHRLIANFISRFINQDIPLKYLIK